MNAGNKITHIIKASGNIEAFSVEKLKTSLRRSGAAERVIEEIARKVETELFEGISTKKIYQMAFRLLNKTRKPAAAKYKIKQAIMELGPSGFPFEKYIGLLLAQQGYKVKTSQFLPGVCVNHEVDIVAETDDRFILAECKYHNLQGIICDIKVPLYIDSRFRDIRNKMEPDEKKYESWIVTNTRFSTDSMQYGLCAGQHLLGWDYPAKDNLKELIDRYKLYPISCLTTLTKSEKRLILEKGIILCKNLVNNSSILEEYNIGGGRRANIIDEALKLSSAL
jgi:hypothetical protein